LVAEVADDDKGPRAKHSAISQWLIAVMRAARRHGYKVPTRVLSMYRTVLTTETVATALASDADLRRVGREFFTTFAWEKLFEGFNQRICRVRFSLSSRYLGLSGQIRQILAESRRPADCQHQRLRGFENATRSKPANKAAGDFGFDSGIAVLIASRNGILCSAYSRSGSLCVLILLYVSLVIQWNRLR